MYVPCAASMNCCASALGLPFSSRWWSRSIHVQVDGKIKKILLSPNKGASDVKYLKWAKSDDPSTWATFDKAVAFARHYKLDGPIVVCFKIKSYVSVLIPVGAVACVKDM